MISANKFNYKSDYNNYKYKFIETNDDTSILYTSDVSNRLSYKPIKLSETCPIFIQFIGYVQCIYRSPLFVAQFIVYSKQ